MYQRGTVGCEHEMHAPDRNTERYRCATLSRRGRMLKTEIMHTELRFPLQRVDSRVPKGPMEVKKFAVQNPTINEPASTEEF